MSDLTLPRPHRRNVRLSDLRVVVLIHKDTNRILCFAQQDAFAKKIARKLGCKIIEIFHAHDYDKYAKLWREQSKEESAAEDHAYLEREDATRQALRKQLRDRIATLADGAEKQAVDSALKTLDVMEDRKKRYRAESFLVQEGYDASKNPGDELIDKLMLNK